MHIDATVYPDLDEPPDQLDTASDQADYIQRICGAWDFGIVPDQETFALFTTWRDVFDAYPLLGSLAYHTFRSTFNWPPIPAIILETLWERYDRQHGRLDPDPCLSHI
jgi:hypothetical protein